MATEAQIAANRRNAKRSTGPRTEAGKLVTRMNAVQSGLYAKSLIVRGEKAADLDQLAAEYYAEFHPATPRERDLVDTLVHNQWLIRRLRRTEADLHARHFSDRDQSFDERRSHHVLQRQHPLADAFDALERQLAHLQSRVNALERSNRHALKELRDLRAHPIAEIGFVPSESPQPTPSASTPVPVPLGFAPPVPPRLTPSASTPDPGPQPPAPFPDPHSPVLTSV